MGWKIIMRYLLALLLTTLVASGQLQTIDLGTGEQTGDSSQTEREINDITNDNDLYLEAQILAGPQSHGDLDNVDDSAKAQYTLGLFDTSSGNYLQFQLRVTTIQLVKDSDESKYGGLLLLKQLGGGVLHVDDASNYDSTEINDINIIQSDNNILKVWVNSRYLDNVFSATNTPYTVPVYADSIIGDSFTAGADQTLTLPTIASSIGVTMFFQKSDSSVNTVIVDGNGAELIDGDATQIITNQYDGLIIVNNGTTWSIKSDNRK